MTKMKKKTVNEQFAEDFSEELDIYTEEIDYPDWIYDIREDMIKKMTKPFRELCQAVRKTGNKFRVKYPLVIDGEWKFADVFIPELNTVVLLVSAYHTIGLPCHSMTDKELWFSRKFNTVAVESFEIHKVRGKLEEIKRKETLINDD